MSTALVKLWVLVNLYLFGLDIANLNTIYSPDSYFHHPNELLNTDFFIFQLMIVFLAGCFYQLVEKEVKPVSLMVIFVWHFFSFWWRYPAISGAFLLVRVLSFLFMLYPFIPKHAMFLMRFQISVVYFFTLYNRVGDPYWMDGSFIGYWAQSMYSRWEFDLPHWLSYTMTHLTTVTELFIGIGLWFQATRAAAFWAGVILFGGLVIFSRIIDFPIMMIFCHMLYFDANSISLWIRRLPFGIIRKKQLIVPD